MASSRLTERAKKGKPETGRIKLSAYQQGGYIVIEVADDGRGLDAQKIRAKALENGLATQAELDRLSDADVFKFIFKPGFSTAQAVSGVSGRGVGMDVVRNNIELIGGTVELKSSSPPGTIFTIKIPLTLAIMAALIVEAVGPPLRHPAIQRDRAGPHRQGLGPRCRADQRHGGAAPARQAPAAARSCRNCCIWRAAARRWSASPTASSTVVVIQVGARLFGVLVDSVFRTEEIVVKPMSSLLRDVGMFSGNTILGDGSVIMIIDPNALGVGGRLGRGSGRAGKRRPPKPRRRE